MTGAESQAVHAVVWGEPEVLFDEIDAGHLVAEHFTEPAHQAVIEAVIHLVAVEAIPTPAGIHEHLIGVGWTTDDAVAAVLMPGAFAPWTGQLWRLPLYLAEVAEQHHRRLMRTRVVILADQLERPGGPARVAAALGVAS